MQRRQYIVLPNWVWQRYETEAEREKAINSYVEKRYGSKIGQTEVNDDAK